MEKKDTHIVLKKDDINKYLSGSEKNTLTMIENKIISGRLKDGKNPVNQYYIVNTDEPYAEEIHKIIFNGENENSANYVLKTPYEKGSMYRTCPCCGKDNLHPLQNKYCSNCGIKLNWSLYNKENEPISNTI